MRFKFRKCHLRLPNNAPEPKKPRSSGDILSKDIVAPAATLRSALISATKFNGLARFF